MPPLVEADRRKPEFNPEAGVPIVLCDGHAWTFSKPVVHLTPDIDADGQVKGAAPGFGPAYEAMLDRFYESEGIARIAALMALAVHSLRVGYDLAPEELQALLRWRPDDPTNIERWQAIADVCQGRGPKREPAGDE